MKYLKKDFYEYSEAACYAVEGEVRNAEGVKPENPVTRLALDEDVVERFVAVAQQAKREGSTIICLTPENIAYRSRLNFGGVSIPIYNMDAKTMKTMLRANYGLVELENGTISAKYNYRDIPY